MPPWWTGTFYAKSQPMPPLASLVLKDFMRPIKHRVGEDEAGVRPYLSDMHCFEVTEVLEVIYDLRNKLLDDPTTTGVLGFLPAERTWIEYNSIGGDGDPPQRQAFLVVEKDKARSARLFFIAESLEYDTEDHTYEFGHAGYWTTDSIYDLKLFNDKPQHVLEDMRAGWRVRPDCDEQEAYKESPDMMGDDPAFVLAALALINSRRVVGRRRHDPHRGLARNLRRFAGGHFPLRAWSEIVLEINAPIDISDDVVEEKRLTGMKALHFCRAHLRIRHGHLEIVRSHWRGDASIGIVRKRYRVALPKD